MGKPPVAPDNHNTSKSPTKRPPIVPTNIYDNTINARFVQSLQHVNRHIRPFNRISLCLY